MRLSWLSLSVLPYRFMFVGGFDCVGQLVAYVLEAENVLYVGLDRDSGAASAPAHSIVTLNAPLAAEHMVRTAREIVPDH